MQMEGERCLGDTEMCGDSAKCVKTYNYTAKTAAGLVDLVGMCNDRDDFKEMMKVVVSLPSLIQQQVEAKIREVEEWKE